MSLHYNLLIKSLQILAESLEENDDRDIYYCYQKLCHCRVEKYTDQWPVTFLSLTIYDQRALLGKAWLLEMQIPFTMFSERRNNRICPISSLRNTGNRFYPDGILKWNSCLGGVNLGAVKAWLLKIKRSRFRWRQSSRHGSSGISRIQNLFLASLLVVKSNNPIW